MPNFWAHFLTFAIFMTVFAAIVGIANSGRNREVSGRVLSASPLVKLIAIVVVGVSPFIVYEIAESLPQLVIGWVVILAAACGCLDILTVQVRVDESGVERKSIFGRRRIDWDEIVEVRMSKIDAAFRIVDRHGDSIKIHHVINGSGAVEAEAARRVANRGIGSAT